MLTSLPFVTNTTLLVPVLVPCLLNVPESTFITMFLSLPSHCHHPSIWGRPHLPSVIWDITHNTEVFPSTSIRSSCNKPIHCVLFPKPCCPQATGILVTEVSTADELIFYHISGKPLSRYLTFTLSSFHISLSQCWPYHFHFNKVLTDEETKTLEDWD